MPARSAANPTDAGLLAGARDSSAARAAAGTTALTDEEGAAGAVEAPGWRADWVQHQSARRIALAGRAGRHTHTRRLHQGNGGKGRTRDVLTR